MNLIKLSLKKDIFFILILLNSFILYSQIYTEPETGKESWRILMQAQDSFEKTDYSKAAKLAQQAVIARKNESSWSTHVLKNAVTPYPVRKVGDNIDEVLEVLKERQEYSAIKIIKYWCTKKGAAFFKNSLSSLQNYLIRLESYPEADYLLAKIFRLEGEYVLADNYLQKAFVSSDLLEVPQLKYDILYEISEIALINKDYDRQEKSLILIVENDGYYKDSALKSAVARTAARTKKGEISKFFKLYRINNIYSCKAYFTLSQYYLTKKQKNEAFCNGAYCVLSQFTHLNSILEDRDPEYHFEDLKMFFYQLSKYPDILEWCVDNKFYDSYISLCDLSLLNGYTVFCTELLENLRDYCPQKYWKIQASEKLQAILNPQPEQLNETQTSIE